MIEHAYIHIPFCKRKCHYCSFVSGFSIKEKNRYLDALYREISTEYKKEKLKTLYIGGGTPSLLNENDIKTIIDFFCFQKEPEITLETNPETVTKEKFIQIKKYGINRISLGVQSFNDNILKLSGRNHNSKEIFESVKILKSAGFNNISIDLIYGLPSQNMNIFKNDIENALELNINHISAYGLKIEQNSYFGKNPPESLPDEDEQAQMFLYLCKILKKNNFNHYEISNFSLKGYKSIHNCAYWQNKNYYGFGLSASGYISNPMQHFDAAECSPFEVAAQNNYRYKNLSIFEEYIKNPEKKEENIFLTEKENMENEIFLALRLNTGINIKQINKKFKIDFEKKYNSIIKKFIDLKLLKYKNGNIVLRKKGILLSNEVMSEFIEV